MSFTGKEKTFKHQTEFIVVSRNVKIWDYLNENKLSY